MLLTGTYQRTLDEKLRLSLPKALRDALGDAAKEPIYLAPGSDGSLSIFPGLAFERLAARLDAASPNAVEIREYRRLFYARATRVELDSHGRLRVPQDLAELASLGHEVVLLGVQDHMELWSQPNWTAYLEGRTQRYDAIAEAAFEDPIPVGKNSGEVMQTPHMASVPKPK